MTIADAIRDRLNNPFLTVRDIERLCISPNFILARGKATSFTDEFRLGMELDYNAMKDLIGREHD